MIDFNKYLEKLEFLIENYKKQVIIVCSSLIFILFIVLIIVISTNNSSKKIDTSSEKINFSEKLLIPQNELEKNSYIESRKTPKNWTKEEVDEYFTPPTKSEIQKLSESNDKIINEILGATP